MRTILENATLLLPNHVIASGSIAIENGAIASVATTPLSIRELKEDFNATHIDLANHLIMPGLVNCHGHTAMTLLRGLGSGLPLQRWLEEAIFPVEAKLTPEDVRAGTVWGAMEMLAGGTTCVADMYDFPADCEDAFREVGMKANLSRVGLAFADDVPPGRLAECVNFVRDDIRDGKVIRDLCIHSEYLTNEKFCRELANENRELKRPIHLHVSETEKEHRECIERHGETPIAYLAKTGLLDFGGYAAHCVYCTDDDFRIMAEKKVTLVHNPTSNMKLGSGFARIPRAIELGVNVALGTDGCASNDNLDMFEEMHLASLIHKGLARDPQVLSAWEIIDMATINGAKALCRDNSGFIASGAKADLCVVNLDRLHLLPCRDVANLIVHSMHSSDVAMTFVDGEIMYDGRDGDHFLAINEERARFDFLKAVPN